MRFIWWILLGILGFLLIVLLIFGRGGKAPSKQIDLTQPDYSSAVLVYTIDGPVVGQENHNAIRISVSDTGRTFEIIQGYEGQATTIKHFDNTQAAYDALTQALQRAGYTNQNTHRTSTSYYSVCPLGNRFIYQIENNNAEVYNTWSTSCNDKGIQTFSGAAALVQQLFQDQIPNYEELTANVQLGSS